MASWARERQRPGRQARPRRPGPAPAARPGHQALDRTRAPDPGFTSTRGQLARVRVGVIRPGSLDWSGLAGRGQASRSGSGSGWNWCCRGRQVRVSWLPGLAARPSPAPVRVPGLPGFHWVGVAWLCPGAFAARGRRRPGPSGRQARVTGGSGQGQLGPGSRGQVSPGPRASGASGCPGSGSGSGSPPPGSPRGRPGSQGPGPWVRSLSGSSSAWAPARQVALWVWARVRPWAPWALPGSSSPRVRVRRPWVWTGWTSSSGFFWTSRPPGARGQAGVRVGVIIGPFFFIVWDRQVVQVRSRLPGPFCQRVRVGRVSRVRPGQVRRPGSVRAGSGRARPGSGLRVRSAGALPGVRSSGVRAGHTGAPGSGCRVALGVGSGSGGLSGSSSGSGPDQVPGWPGTRLPGLVRSSGHRGRPGSSPSQARPRLGPRRQAGSGSAGRSGSGFSQASCCQGQAVGVRLTSWAGQAWARVQELADLLPGHRFRGVRTSGGTGTGHRASTGSGSTGHFHQSAGLGQPGSGSGTGQGWNLLSRLSTCFSD